MVDFFKNEYDDNGISYATTVNLCKLKEWAEQKDRQIQELRTMVEQLAFKDVSRWDMKELHLDWRE